MPRYLPYAFAGIILGLLIGVPWTYLAWRNREFRNFHVVEEGVLYRSGQLSPDGLKRIIHDHGIKTVVTLRYAPSPDKPAPDQDEENMCRAAGLHYFRLKYQPWTGSENDAAVPAEANIRQFLAIMKDPRNHPVLVHCFAGIHRTGAMCAIYRMEFDRWSPERALREMRELGYSAKHRDVFSYLENYQARGCSLGSLQPEVGPSVPPNPPENIRPVNNADPRNPVGRPVLYLAVPGDMLQVDVGPNAPSLGGKIRIQPDGTIDLPAAGSIYVAGLSHRQIASVVRARLKNLGIDAAVTVDVLSADDPTPCYCLIISGDSIRERLIRQTWTAGTTIQDVLAPVCGELDVLLKRRVWIVRNGNSDRGEMRVLTVSWPELRQGSLTAVNYPIFPGDQIHIYESVAFPGKQATHGWLENPLLEFVSWTSSWLIPSESRSRR